MYVKIVTEMGNAEEKKESVNSKLSASASALNKKMYICAIRFSRSPSLKINGGQIITAVIAIRTYDTWCEMRCDFDMSKC